MTSTTETTAPALTTTNQHGSPVVVDPTGGTWTPDEDVLAEVGDDEAALIAVCERDPMRGTWSC